MGEHRRFGNYNFSLLRELVSGRDVGVGRHYRFDSHHLKIYEYLQLFARRLESRSKKSITNPQGELGRQVFWCDNLEIRYSFRQFCPKSCNIASRDHNSKPKRLTHSSFNHKNEYLIICTNFMSDTKFMN